MTCTDCKSRKNCPYPVLEDWECGCFYPPCSHLSQNHLDSIDNHIKEALEAFGDPEDY